MRLHPAWLPLVLTLTGGSLSHGQTAEPAANPQPKAEAIDNLLSERGSPAAFKATIDIARRAGVNEQTILEARFLYHVDMREDDAIAALLPEFLKQNESFRIENSSIFAIKDDWLAVIEYVKAIAALQQNDKASFKQHITEAFWLSPRQAAAFAPHIERIRQDEAMRAVQLNLDTPYPTLQGGQPIALKTVLDSKKAMLLHFWSPKSRECEISLPDFDKTCEMLSAHGIAVASVTPNDPTETLRLARTMMQPHDKKHCGSWLIDNGGASLGDQLRIQNLPAMVIVTPDGHILFNGDPTDDQFWIALKKIDPTITRPEAEGNYEE